MQSEYLSNGNINVMRARAAAELLNEGRGYPPSPPRIADRYILKLLLFKIKKSAGRNIFIIDIKFH